MKKLLYSAVAFATLLFAACQQENLESIAGGNTVTYTISVPGALATKAIGTNVDAVTELVYEVYRTEAQSADDYDAKEMRLYQKTAKITQGVAYVTLELVNNQNFRVLFWAQVPGTGIYDTTVDLKNVTIGQPLKANQKNYAAFAGSDFIKSGDQLAGRTVLLKRPVAQLNIATTPESLILGEGEGSNFTTAVEIETSKVTVNGLATSYNIAEASVSTLSDADFVYAAQSPAGLTDDDTQKNEIVVNGETYNYVSMNYLAFAPALGTNVEVTYEIETNVGTITNTISSVPVKPNYRTNIVGNLITSTSDYTVYLDEKWAGDLVGVETASDLQAAIDAASTGDEIMLTGDINLNELTKSQRDYKAALVIPADKSLSINLAGYNMTWESEVAGDMMIKNEGKLALIGEGKVSYKYTGEGDATYGKGNYTVYNTGDLTIDGPTVENATAAMSHASYAVNNSCNFHMKSGKVLNANNYAVRALAMTESNIVVDGGEISGVRAFWIQLPGSASTVAPVLNLTINGGILNSTPDKSGYELAIYSYSYGYNMKNVKIDINGGEINGDIALTGGMNKENIETLNITGGTINGEVYSYGDAAKAAAAITITGGQFANMSGFEYACSENEVYTLGADVTFAETLALSGKVFTLDGNGHTITQAEDCNNNIALFDLTGGKATFKNITFDGIQKGAVIRTVDTEFVADNVTVKNCNHTQIQGLVRLCGKNTVTGCIFENNQCTMGLTINFDATSETPQVVENCEFNGNTCNGTAVLYYVDGEKANINGNKFIGNTVNCNNNGATVYMGFTEGNTVTNNLFQNNTVNEAGSSSRVAGGIFFGYKTVFTGNAFIGNKVTGDNAKGNDVCVSTYYTNIDLSGNYWGGAAPVEDVNYFVQHKSTERVVIANDYLTSYSL